MAKPETPTPAANVVVPVDELTPPTAAEVGSPDEVGVIDTDMGRIVLEFFPDVAPVHVANFKKLARAGFYDGTTFHRVVPGFVIQGGDGAPLGYTIKDEPVTTKYERGTVAMARTGQPDSVDSQFFIVLDDGAASSLAGPGYNNYQIVGKVSSGMEVVDAIAAAADAENPTHPVVMTKVTVSK